MRRLRGRTVVWVHRLRLVACLLCGIAVIVVVCSAAGRTPRPCPEVEKTSAGVRVKMPGYFLRALPDAAPGFQPLAMSDYSPTIRDAYRFSPAETPWAIVGDFDGDGFCDLVIDGRSTTDTYRLCAWGSAEGPRVMTLGRRRLKGALKLSTAELVLIPKEDVQRRELLKPGYRARDAFGERVAGKLARIYTWRKGRFGQSDLKK